jgi:hypothetical protein
VVKLRHPGKESRNCELRIANCGLPGEPVSATLQSLIGNPHSAIRN